MYDNWPRWVPPPSCLCHLSCPPGCLCQPHYPQMLFIIIASFPTNPLLFNYWHLAVKTRGTKKREKKSSKLRELCFRIRLWVVTLCSSVSLYPSFCSPSFLVCTFIQVYTIMDYALACYFMWLLFLGSKYEKNIMEYVGAHMDPVHIQVLLNLK